MDWPLYWRLPASSDLQLSPEKFSELILDRFLDYISYQGLELYSAQEEAVLELIDGSNVILNTPTGSGKSLVAMAVHFASLARRGRSIYTCPIKALVNEKFRDLCALFGPDQVGMITGDGSVNAQAPILCCTAEILANLALRDGAEAAVDDVIMDEFHYYSDRQRGVAWQIPLLTLRKARFLLMSATLGDMDFFVERLTQLNGRKTAVVQSAERPVPLHFEYRETPLHETVGDLVSQGLAPVYMVNFSQREASEEAQNLLSVDFASKDEKVKIAQALAGARFDSPFGKDLQRLLRHGVGLHHAGLLPKYRALVERLAQQGLLKVICGTDTLGVGVNVPIRTVLLSKLCKFDGEKTSILSVREFQQISGRAGRRGFDNQGTVAVQAPAHVIENLKMKAKAAGDAKKLRKLVMKTPPPTGFVMWNRETFDRLINSKPEALVSRFQVTHGMLLNVLSRGRLGCKAMQKLIHDSHDERKGQKASFKTAFELYRALLDRKIVEVVKEDGQVSLRLNVDLQEDFSLNHSLALYLLDAVEILASEKAEKGVDDFAYALDLLTLVESILESPELILRKQLDRVKSEKMAELKASGVEYEQRIEELEKLEHPKPNQEFIYETFRIFAANHPWVGQENIRPKSIAREMYENFYSFSGYIREYGLTRGEGILLRYLSEVYKVLVQTIPERAKNEEVRALAIYFGAMVRRVDSSLIEDWEAMRGRELKRADSPEETPELASDITRDAKGFTLLVRNEVHQVIRALATSDYESVLELVRPTYPDSEELWSAEQIEQRLQSYYQDHQRICTDPSARRHDLCQIVKDSQFWQVEQRLVDPDEHNDWVVQLRVDLAASKLASRVTLDLVDITSLSH